MVILTRWLYRAGQFFAALRARPSDTDFVLVNQILTTTPQAELFARLQGSEQAHSLQVLRRLMAQGETDADLLAAALLHDVGKCIRPLHLWERVWIVLGKAIYPRQVEAWGREDGLAFFWRRPFIVAAQHPAWGARLAAAAGCSARAVELIARHQDPSVSDSPNDLDRLLIRLQLSDDKA